MSESSSETPMNRLSTSKLNGFLRCLALAALLAAMNTSVASAFVQEGCTNPFACNYDVSATDDDGSCEYFSCIGCMNEFACNFDPLALYPDLSCEYFSCAGCTAPLACNFDDNATIPDESACDFESCAGCMDFTACNFDSEATLSIPSSCEYPLPNYDCNGVLVGCTNCAPLFLAAFDPDTVQCVSDLPSGTDPGIVAIDPSTGDTLEVTSFFGEVIGSQSFNLANTAEGDGPDGAIRLFGLADQLGLAESDYFVESFPLILTRFSNGVALVTGQVADSENDNLKWNLHLVLEDMQTAETWLNESVGHELMTALQCEADTSIWMTYRMDNSQSYLIGSGGYDGSWLQLSHMPFNESKRFQLGPGGNSVNCEYGLGGWFAWEGEVLGQSVMGLAGDLVVDLGDDVLINVPCGDEFVAQFYNSLNPTSGDFTSKTQYTYAVDTTAPVMESSCESTVSLCFEPGVGVTLPDPCSFAEDNCGLGLDSNYADVILSGNPDAGDDAPFEIERTYTASDCSGNVGIFVQTLIFDGGGCEDPEGLLESPADGIEDSDDETFNPPSAKNPFEQFFTTGSTIAPNPTASSSTLRVQRTQAANATVSVYNLAGQQAMSSIQLDGNDRESAALILLDASELVSGCYLVRIEHLEEVETLRWIISK